MTEKKYLFFLTEPFREYFFTTHPLQPLFFPFLQTCRMKKPIHILPGIDICLKLFHTYFWPLPYYFVEPFPLQLQSEVLPVFHNSPEKSFPSFPGASSNDQFVIHLVL